MTWNDRWETMRGDYRQNEMLQYAILLWSFRLHNWCYGLSIWHRKFHLSTLYFVMYLNIPLCTSTWQYYVMYSVILTWRFRLLWRCFSLSIWQCKVLYPIVQFYILLCTYICYHPRSGYFQKFCILFCVPVLWSVSSCEVVSYLRHILHGTQWTKIRRPSRGNGYRSQPRCHFLPSAVKKTDNVDCHVAARNHLRNVLFNILRQLESGNSDLDTMDHVQYRLDCLYRVILGCFDAGIVDERVHCSFHFSLVADSLFLFKVRRGHVIKKQNNLLSTERQT